MERATKMMQLVLLMLLVSSTSLQHVSDARHIQGQGDGFPLLFESLKGSIPGSASSGCTNVGSSSSGVCPPNTPRSN
jgi:hypothetical protein